MFTQKLYRNGNSVAVTIPKPLLEELNLKEGSEVMLEKEGKGIAVSTKNNKLAPDVDAEFMKMVEEFANEHDDVLRELAKR
jgi:putative addiction module antidote